MRHYAYVEAGEGVQKGGCTDGPYTLGTTLGASLPALDIWDLEPSQTFFSWRGLSKALGRVCVPSEEGVG